jgi:hemolysin-activating ACP:hemolysin acyltransferase
MASDYPDAFLSPRDDWPVGFVTWALMNRESIEAYTLATRKFTPDDFCSGAELWVIDMIAPYGSVGRMARAIRQLLSERYPNQKAHIIRNNRTARRRLGHFARSD